jgi:uncharacterized membrane protein YhaH (DUF805 family)
MKTLLDIPLSLWGVLCFVIATVYYYVWPKPEPKARPRPLWMHLILRYAHSVVWVTLAFVCALVYAGQMALAEPLAYLALLLYATFMIVLFIDRRQSGKKRT